MNRGPSPIHILDSVENIVVSQANMGSKGEAAAEPKEESSCPPVPDQPSKKTTLVKCNGCGKDFPSRNAVFKHLKDTDGACLSKEEYKDFVRYVRKSVKPPKVILLYGYLPYNGSSNSSGSLETPASDGPEERGANGITVRNGQDAGTILMQAIAEVQNEIDGFDDGGDDDNNDSSSVQKLNRSYGNSSRSAECVQQDMDTGAVTEVMAVRLYPLRVDMSMEDWLDRVQKKLDAKFEQKDENAMDVDGNDDCPVTPIRVLGRQDMPNKKFNAEMDVSVTARDVKKEK